MPELPEVETVRRTLEPLLVGHRVQALDVPDPHCLEGGTPRGLAAALVGAVFCGVARRGKFLAFELERAGGGRVWLYAHLRMTGQLVYVAPASGPAASRLRARFVLDGGAELRFYDTRRLGRLYLEAPATVGRLGPEPLAGQLSLAGFSRRLKARRRRIKALLLDQGFLAGVGNIYADECLFLSRIHPLRGAATLRPAEARRLHRALLAVMAAAIASRGTTISDYVDGEGRPGEFAVSLNVYGREGEDCSRCGATIERIKIAGRSSYFCPRCQRFCP